jgi:hypothetical protein
MLAVVRAKINDHDVRLEIQRVGVGRTPDVGKITMMQQRRGTHAKVAHVVICPQPLTELHRIGCFVRSSFVHWCFCWFRRQAPPPNTVGFQRLARQLTSLPRSPKTSLIAHANTSSAPDGLGFFCKKSSFAHVMSVFINLRNWCSPVKQKNVL